MLDQAESDGLSERQDFSAETGLNLRNELELLDAVLNSMPGILFMLDQNGHIIRWNSRLEDVTEYASEAIQKMHPTDFFEEREHDLIRRSIEEVFANGQAEVEANLLTRTRKRIPYRFMGYRSLIQGQPCLVGIGLDRTESRKAEKDRQASQERYQLLAEVTHDAIWDYQLEEDLIAWNRGFSRLTGFEDTGPAVTFAGWSQLLHPEESQEVLGSLSQAMRAGVANWSREHRFARQDGSYAWVLNRAYLIQDESGKLVRLIA